MQTLVIVESSTKAKKIGQFLGNKYVVKASNGHLRELAKKNMGIDVENGFKPSFDFIKGKYKIITELKKLAKGKKVIIASDLDREGEAIGWHLCKILKLNPITTDRIVFDQITKEAILKAIKKPRKINMNLVQAQFARSILDKLIGFEFSPLLWRRIQSGLSAGRVQSVALRLICEREKEIENHNPEPYYQTNAIFDNQLKGTLDKKHKNDKEIIDFLKHAYKAEYEIEDIKIKEVFKNPPPPATTSTFQQQAAKQGIRPKLAMSIAQKLYETGKITYHRTDSTTLSPIFLNTSKGYIEEHYTEQYYKRRQYKSKQKSAQEAHEAIRPTYVNNLKVGEGLHQKVYEIIWKRAVASQMSAEKVKQIDVTVKLNNRPEKFILKGEITLFDGYTILYKTKEKDTKQAEKLSKLKKGDKINYKEIKSEGKMTQPKLRYNNTLLIKKMETLGIGRPSTYATILDTLQKKYIKEKSTPGKSVETKTYMIKPNIKKIKTDSKKIQIGAEKSKFFPNECADDVIQFLVKEFPKIFEYEFTSQMEKQLDSITSGKANWQETIGNCYDIFHPKIVHLKQTSPKKSSDRKPITEISGEPVYAYRGRYGQVLQIGGSDKKEKPKFIKIPDKYKIKSLTPEEVMEIISNHKEKKTWNIGKYKGKDIIVREGRYGPFFTLNKVHYSLGKILPDELTLEQIPELIERKQNAKPYKPFKKKNFKKSKK